jgi:hypothetical protein
MAKYIGLVKTSHGADLYIHIMPWARNFGLNYVSEIFVEN